MGDLDHILQRLISERDSRAGDWWQRPAGTPHSPTWPEPRPLVDLDDIPGYGPHLELDARIDLLVRHGRLDDPRGDK